MQAGIARSTCHLQGPVLIRDCEYLRLFLTHQEALIEYAKAIVGCRLRAEDVVQDAYLRFVGVAADRPPDQPLKYLYRIVRNRALDLTRRMRLEQHYFCAADLAANIPTDGPSQETEAIHKNDLKIVLAAIDELPDRTRIALKMHRLNGDRLKDVADRLGISLALAHGLICKGVEHCRCRLRECS